jgi:hypothetical protein
MNEVTQVGFYIRPGHLIDRFFKAYMGLNM